MEGDGRIAQTVFNLLNGLEELDFRIVRSEITDSLGIYKNNLLLTILQEPQDEVRVKITCFKEADPAAAAEISQQVQLTGLKEGLILIMECLEIFHKIPLALVKRGRTNLNDRGIQAKQGLIEVTSKPKCLDALKSPGFHLSLFNRRFEFFQFFDNFYL